MSFLRKFGYSAIGFTLLLSAMIIQWNPLLEIFWHGVFNDGDFQDSFIGFKTLIESDFAAGAVLVSYGVLLGKVCYLRLSYS